MRDPGPIRVVRDPGPVSMVDICQSHRNYRSVVHNIHMYIYTYIFPKT